MAISWVMDSHISTIPAQLTFSDVAILALSLVGVSSYYGNGKIWNRRDPLEYKLYERPQKSSQEKSTQLIELSRARNIATQIDELNKDGVIFWASQSGRAEAFAYRLEKELSRRFAANTIVADLSDYDHHTIALISETKFAIFVLSTYGEGEPPDNGWTFWDWLKSTSEDLTLQNLHYAAFGLGNSNYRFYNKVVDVVTNALEHKGATSLLSIGRADEAKNDTEEDFLQWKESLLQALQKQYNLEEHHVRYCPSISVTQQPHLNTSLLHKRPSMSYSVNSKISTVIEAPVADVRSITSARSSKTCLHLEIDLSDHIEMKYKTGDHLVVWPKNPDNEVYLLLDTLSLRQSSHLPISITTLAGSQPYVNTPTFTTLDHVFRHELEICASVSRDTVRALCEFAPSDNVKSSLSMISSSKELYAAFTANRHITLARLLEYTRDIDPAASWSELPLSFVLEHLRPMAPRYYSISSSSSVSPRRAAITVSMSSTTLPTTPTIVIPGLTSSYLSTLDSNKLPQDGQQASLRVQLRRSDFKLPASSATPLILIAAGSGIAPIRAFLHERARLATIGRESGKILLFYGCRHPDQDYLYRTELEDFASGALHGKLQIYPAFSQYEGNKVYVQERIAQNCVLVTRLLIEENASVYICGSTVMAKASGDMIVRAVKEYSSLGDREAQQWRINLKRFRRWQEDVWG